MTTCYKTEVCKESHCVEKQEVCYKTDDCTFDYCVEPTTEIDDVQETGK